MKKYFWILFALAFMVPALKIEAQKKINSGGRINTKPSPKSNYKKTKGFRKNGMKITAYKPVRKTKVATDPTMKSIAKNIKSEGRSGRQARLKQLANDPKLGRYERGWIKQEINAKRKNIRVPPDRELAHKRGFEAAKGHSYKHSHLQAREMHKIQHKFDGGGKKQITPNIRK